MPSLECPADALGALIDAVPDAVPVALLVDEYDAAIIQDVSKGRWAAADMGVEALRSLAMTTLPGPLIKAGRRAMQKAIRVRMVALMSSYALVAANRCSSPAGSIRSPSA